MALDKDRLAEITHAAAVQQLLGEAVVLTPSQLNRMLAEKLQNPAYRKLKLNMGEAREFYEKIFREAVDLMFAPPSKDDDHGHGHGHGGGRGH